MFQLRCVSRIFGNMLVLMLFSSNMRSAYYHINLSRHSVRGDMLLVFVVK